MSARNYSERVATAHQLLLKRLKHEPDYAAFEAARLLKLLEVSAGAAASELLLALPGEMEGRRGEQSAEFIEARTLRRRLAMFVGIHQRMACALRDFVESVLLRQ